jgi:hypothetical protein
MNIGRFKDFNWFLQKGTRARLHATAPGQEEGESAPGFNAQCSEMNLIPVFLNLP